MTYREIEDVYLNVQLINIIKEVLDSVLLPNIM